MSPFYCKRSIPQVFAVILSYLASWLMKNWFLELPSNFCCFFAGSSGVFSPCFPVVDDDTRWHAYLDDGLCCSFILLPFYVFICTAIEDEETWGASAAHWNLPSTKYQLVNGEATNILFCGEFMQNAVTVDTFITNLWYCTYWILCMYGIK